ncbi:type II secretion system minor pseudopilin GspK [Pseudomaricurvus alkylphenolicus]|uniref:type II secretion system minor pseudopilin GspK n=1 Tax=Pseudomaricurvus alkylphenolicus TaxID=1306991 RepID=UPI00141F15BF|nr:type II secretion system minor pseudopilin GspK [Pseudomaricurvus alkylphenolicus]NIB41418.1 type II secretion system minor pseudopilin GspK [Pseudomaricurvus alkylphenolicus]
MNKGPQLVNKSPQSGFALLGVLFLITVILLTLGSLFYRHQLDISRTARALTSEQAILLALSGENWAKQVLLDDIIANGIDHLEENWAQPTPVLPVEGGTLSGCLKDLQGHINVNNLLRYALDSQYQKALNLEEVGAGAQLLRLFNQLQLEEPKQRIDSIKDWVDADSQPGRYGGAEDGTYQLQSNSRRTGNWPLLSTEELNGLVGFAPGENRFLHTWLSALPEATPININTASKEVLASLLNEFPERALDDVIAYRPFADLDAFYQRLLNLQLAASDQKLKERIPTDSVAINSKYFQLDSVITLGDQTIHARSLLHRSSAEAVSILQRNLVFLPDLIDGEGNPVVRPHVCLSTDSSNRS